MRLRAPKIFVGRSVNVPNVGNPDLLGALLVLLWAGLRTGAGAGGAGIGGGERYFCRIVTLAAVEDEEMDEATDRARTSSTSPASSSASLITASPSLVPTSWSSPSGNGKCSARKVSLSFAETPCCLHSLSTTSRLLVNSHWSWYFHVFLRGVSPVGSSSLVPASTKDSVT